MSKSLIKKVRLLIVIAIACLFVWVLVVSPMLTFKNNEKKLESAAMRYFELNSNQLPTGERIKTVSLGTLYHESYIDSDLYIPLTKKTCSVTNSWVKVRRENNEYKYYSYLECGLMKSSIDHIGPEIKLNGDDEVTIGLGESFTDPGVKSVTDNTDGKLKVEDVIIKGSVDTSKMGSYEIQYIASDSLSNKTTAIRTVSVVQKLNSTVKKATGDVGYYIGANPNNYIYFSNMMFRIIGMNGKNVKIIADNDIANVNYDAIDDWFNYYEDHLTDGAKKLIVKSKYCNMTLTDTTLDTSECSSYSKKKNFGLISVDEINRANTDDGNYLMLSTISWTANVKDKDNTYTSRFFYYNTDSSYMSFENVHNFGVRPVITINGDALITSGDGTENNPYYLEDYIKGKKKAHINSRYSGEYISYSGYLWRIVETLSDETTKVVMEETLHNDGAPIEINYKTTGTKLYNPTEKGNVAYIFNNRASEFIDTKYFVNHEIEVPIYKKEPNYGKEIETKTYKVKVSAPNMYEMFSAMPINPNVKSYWVINSSKSKSEFPGVSDIGVVMYGNASVDYTYGIRPVGYLNKDCIITSGNGTKDNPFVISK